MVGRDDSAFPLGNLLLRMLHRRTRTIREAAKNGLFCHATQASSSHISMHPSVNLSCVHFHILRLLLLKMFGNMHLIVEHLLGRLFFLHICILPLKCCFELLL